uniref:Large ribosomal subunit protein uL22c n=1 Tax=Neogoniolithon spectabile TaxID=231755 RepID=A0A3G3MGW3_9FLOR|nr:ribosomal protein L22 [Neogoniolithon spectabile]AYR06032.1 ribosomal protein L22 [Neogoniolithon spectabile]
MPRSAKAQEYYTRISPNKVRRVLDQIRGQKYEEAIMILEFMPYKSCKKIKQILQSAAYNAFHLYGDKINRLIVSRTFANTGPTLKRFQPRAQGRAFKIKKPTCHIIIEVSYIN